MIFLYAFLIAASVLSGLQTGSNATLNKKLANPAFSSLVAEIVGLLTLFAIFGIYLLWTRHPMPQAQQWRAIPWWSWLGGAMSAVYTIAIFVVAEKTSAGTFIVVSVTTTTLTSLAMDHFALMGYPQHTAGPGRLVGAALMVAGLCFIAKF